MQRILAQLESFRVLDDARLSGAWRMLGMLLAMILAPGLPQAWVLAQTPLTMQISDIHGQIWKGNLVSVDQEQVVYKATDSSSDAEIIKRTEEILRMDRSGSKKPVTATESIRAGLVDGSLLNLQKIEGKEKNWTIEFSNGLAQTGILGELKHLKLKKLDANSQEAWESYLREDIKSDALIVIRPGGSLDRVDGLVKEIRDGKVLFDVDGQVVEASVDRLAGVIWYRKQQSTVTDGFQVRLSNGSLLNSRKVSFNDGSAQIQGPWGVPLVVPLDWIESIDCGLNKLSWVSGLEPLEAFALKKTGFGEFDSVLASTFKPRWVEGEGGNQNLLFSAPGGYVFRAPAGMTKLQTRLQRANESNAQSPVSIEVWVDDQVAFKKELGAQQQSIDVEVGIASEKKIKFVVASKSALNLGTRVMLIQPRVSK